MIEQCFGGIDAGLSVRRINPNRLRQFARARGALAKNDRLDARLIAEYVATMPTHVVRHDPAAARIAEIVTMRRQLSQAPLGADRGRYSPPREARRRADSRQARSRPALRAACLEARRRPRARLPPHRPVAGARPHES